MNVDAGQAIAQLISQAGLTAQVPTAGVTVGHIIQDDYASMSRNLRQLEFINAIAVGLNWTVRVRGTTVIVGPAPAYNEVPTLNKIWNAGAGISLSITHSPYASKNIKVRVVSYIPGTKSRVSSDADLSDPYIQSLLAGSTLNLPEVTAPSNTRGGRQVGFASGPLTESAEEIYVRHVPGITSAKADALAARIAADIAQHEYVLQMKWAPDLTELKTIAQSSPEFLINLSGVKPSARGLYHMRHVHWDWSLEEGLTVEVLAVNHTIPTNTGGE